MLWKASCRDISLSLSGQARLRSTSPEVVALFDDLLEDGSLLRVKVTGRSMKPFLAGGEILTIRKVQTSSLRRGDIILFRSRGGTAVVHRLIRKKKEHKNAVFFETKGDALKSCDEIVCEGDILGKVCTIQGRHSRDMEAGTWIAINYLLAIAHSLKTGIFSTLGSCRDLLRAVS